MTQSARTRIDGGTVKRSFSTPTVGLAHVGHPADSRVRGRALGERGRGVQGHESRNEGEHGPARERFPPSGRR
jgi:hypothetical protein